MDIDDALVAAADELMKNAPGRVHVHRVSHIDDVKVVREARAALTPAQQNDLAQLRLLLMERLDGVLAVSARPTAQRKEGLLGVLLRPLEFIVNNVSNDMWAHGGYEDKARESGKVTRLPAPADLLDAAELWAMSHMIGDQLEGNLDVLRSPWEQATVDPT